MSLLVPPEQVVSNTLPAGEVVVVVGDLACELADVSKVGLDSVEPAGVGRSKNGLDVVSGHKIGQKRGPVSAEVIHYNVEPDLCRIAGSQLLKDRQDVSARLTLMDFAYQTPGMDIPESQELLGALKSAVGSRQAPRPAMTLPGASVKRS